MFQNATSLTVKDATDGSTQFRQGMMRRTEQSTDYGPAQNNAATIIHITLQMVSTFWILYRYSFHKNLFFFLAVRLPVKKVAHLAQWLTWASHQCYMGSVPSIET